MGNRLNVNARLVDKDGNAVNVTGGALEVTLSSDCFLLTTGENPLDTEAALFNPDPAVTQGDGLRVIASSGTPASGANGPGITFGAIGESVAAKRAAIVPYQDGSDPDTVGLSFFTHPASTGVEDLVESVRIDSDGRLRVGDTNKNGVLNLGNEATGDSAVNLNIRHGGTSATDASQIQLFVQPGGGDAIVKFDVEGAQQYTIGVDNDQNDEFKMSRSSLLQTDTFFRVTTSGVVQINGVAGSNNFAIQTTRSDPGRIVNNQVRNTDNTNGASHAKFEITSGGSSGGDCWVNFKVTSVTDWSVGIDNSDSDAFKVSAASAVGSNDLVIRTGGQVGIGVSGTAAKLHVQQGSSTAAIPVLELDQDDTDQPFIEFDGNAAAGTSTSISTDTTAGSIQGFIQVTINGTARWIPFYDDPS